MRGVRPCIPESSFLPRSWTKQHLRIKSSFFGTFGNTVKTPDLGAVPVYILVAILKHRPGLKASLHTILQVLNLTPFEKIPRMNWAWQNQLAPAL